MSDNLFEQMVDDFRMAVQEELWEIHARFRARGLPAPEKCPLVVIEQQAEEESGPTLD